MTGPRSFYLAAKIRGSLPFACQSQRESGKRKRGNGRYWSACQADYITVCSCAISTSSLRETPGLVYLRNNSRADAIRVRCMCPEIKNGNVYFDLILERADSRTVKRIRIQDRKSVDKSVSWRRSTVTRRLKLLKCDGDCFLFSNSIIDAW